MKLPAVLLIAMSIISCDKNAQTDSLQNTKNNVEESENNNSNSNENNLDNSENYHSDDNCPACGMG